MDHGVLESTGRGSCKVDHFKNRAKGSKEGSNIKTPESTMKKTTLQATHLDGLRYSHGLFHAPQTVRVLQLHVGALD